MSNTRTKQIFLGKGVASDTTIYTVPAGKTTIVKEIVMTHNGNTSTCRLNYRKGGLSMGYGFWQLLAQNTPARVHTWDVLLPGDTIVFLTDAGTPSTVLISISGTELDGVAP